MLSLSVFLAFGMALPAATLSVSPSTTSNTYIGSITLQIGGLTNAEPVVVQSFLDANANGIVDPGEPLVDTFAITDGGVSTIGGKTNLNVPFDGNAGGGAITTTLFFGGGQLIDDFVGRHIFRVLSPSDRFPAVEATFTVTNAAISQSFTGQVFLAGSPATNAVVIALTGVNGSYAGGTMADSAGRYSLRLPTNSYTLIASQPNTYFDAAASPQVVLTAGVTATNNLYLTNGTVAISGSVRDATNSASLGGVFLLIESGDYLAVAFSASNGTFSASVSPASWKASIQEDRMSRRGYVAPKKSGQADTTTGAVANVSLKLPKADAMFYGRLTNSLGGTFPNLRFEADDGQNGDPSMFKGRGVGDASGFYTVAVLAETNGWYCSPSSDSLALARYVVSGGQATTLIAGQAFQQDFTALATTATISGKVLDHLGNPVAGVGFGGGAFINGANYSTFNVTTDNSGNYSLGVVPGGWGVHFTSDDPFSSDSLANHGLMDLFGYYLVTVPPTNPVLNITVYPLGSSALRAPVRFSPSEVSLDVLGSIGTNYTLQVSTNVASTNWSTLSSFQLPSSPFSVTDSQATNASRFYRLKRN